MSKYLLLVFFFLFPFFQLFSQTNSFKKDESIEKSSIVYGPKTLESSAITNADFEKIIMRKKLINELIGNWKMIDDAPEWVMRDTDSIVGQMISITTEEIQFFDLIRNAKSWKKVSIEKILYIDKLADQSFYSELVFANNQIWQFNIDEKTGYLKLTYTGDKFSDSDTERTEFVCSMPTKTYFKLN